MTLKILAAYLIFFLFNLALNAILTRWLGKGRGKPGKSQEGPNAPPRIAFLTNPTTGKRIQIDPGWIPELERLLAGQDQIRIERKV